MDFLAATFLAFKVIGNLVKIDYVDNVTGTERERIIPPRSLQYQRFLIT